MTANRLYLSLLALAFTMLPSLSFAQLQLNTCAPGVQPWQVTTKLIVCLQTNIISSMNAYISVYTDLLVPTISVFMALAVVLFAIKLLYVPKDLQKLTWGFMLRFLIVGGFAFNMSEVVMWPFMIVGDMVRMVSTLFAQGDTPWTQLDNYIGRLLGFGQATSMGQGLIGVLGAALFSGLNGMLVFLLGSLSVIATLYFAFRAVFTYLSSIMLIAFIMLISPLIVPLALFVQTERAQFKKWLDLLISAMINPVVVIAFLFMFLGMLNTMIGLSINAIHGSQGCTTQAVISGTCTPSTNFSNYWRTNKNMGSWLLPTDPQAWQNMAQQLGPPTPTGNPNDRSATPAVQNFMSPTLLSSMDTNVLSTASLDFGPQQVWTMQLLTLNFLGLFIVVYMLLSLLSTVPNIADSLGGVTTGLAWEGMPLLKEAQMAVSKMRSMAGNSP